MRGAKPGTTRVWEILYDGAADGPAGPAGDGTFIKRFGSQKPADDFAAANTCYGKPAKADFVDAPNKTARRWGF